MQAHAYRYHVSKYPPMSREQELEACANLRRQRQECWVAVLLVSTPEQVTAAFTFPKREKGDSAAGSKNEAEAHDAFRKIQATRPWRSWASLHDPANKTSALLQSALPSVAADLARELSACDPDLLALARVADPVAPTWLALWRQIRDFEARNLGLVYMVAGAYLRKKPGLGQNMSTDELAAHGFDGLRTATLRFNASRGFKFSTYAVGWIRHRVGRAIDDLSRTIRVPVHAIELSHKILTMMNKAALAGLPAPSDDEMADVLGTTAAKVARVRSTTGHPFSLNDRLRGREEESDEEYQDLLAAPDDHEDEMRRDSDAEQVRRALAGLTDMQVEVLRRRFDNEETLADIAADHGLSRERIRQIEVAGRLGVKVAIEAEEKSVVRRRRAVRQAEVAHV